MALSKNAQRTIWTARKNGANPEETLAYCLKEKARGLEMEDEATLADHISKMGEYKERPGAGGWVKKAQILKQDPFKQAREQVAEQVKAGVITDEQAADILKVVDTKEQERKQAHADSVMASLMALANNL